MPMFSSTKQHRHATRSQERTESRLAKIMKARRVDGKTQRRIQRAIDQEKEHAKECAEEGEQALPRVIFSKRQETAVILNMGDSLALVYMQGVERDAIVEYKGRRVRLVKKVADGHWLDYIEMWECECVE